ncbi:MAG: DUF6768 family protein [Planctomycetota bacterium]
MNTEPTHDLDSEQADERLRSVLLRHLSADEARAVAADHERSAAAVLDAMQNKSRRRAALPTALQVSLGVAMSMTAVAFLRADNLHAELLLSTVFGLLAVLAVALCLWTWMRRHHHATLRELKRLELALVLFARGRDEVDA